MGVWDGEAAGYERTSGDPHHDGEESAVVPCWRGPDFEGEAVFWVRDGDLISREVLTKHGGCTDIALDAYRDILCGV